MLDAAIDHARRASRLRTQLPQFVRAGKWIQPGFEKSITNVELAFDFFEHAMATVLLAFTALDNFANEAIPPEFSLTDAKGQVHGRHAIESNFGLPRRLSQVLPVITGREGLETARPDTWASVHALKKIRDDLSHVHLDDTFTTANAAPKEGLFSRLLAADLLECLAMVEAVMVYFSST